MCSISASLTEKKEYENLLSALPLEEDAGFRKILDEVVAYFNTELDKSTHELECVLNFYPLTSEEKAKLSGSQTGMPSNTLTTKQLFYFYSRFDKNYHIKEKVEKIYHHELHRWWHVLRQYFLGESSLQERRIHTLNQLNHMLINKGL